MGALVKAAQKEGQLNLVSVSPDWANYGAITKAFEDKYKIKIVSSNPEGSSQDEINAAKQLAGTDRAPDVFDLGARELADTSLFAPYKVETWDKIPNSQKEPTGLYAKDYGGYMSIGYDSKAVPEVTSVAALLKPAYRGKVALFADPTQSTSALTAVMMTSLANGGSATDIAPGVDFFSKLRKSGNFVPVAATKATVQNGTTSVIINWDYLAVNFANDVPGWKVIVPSDAAVSAYYNAAINKTAPHPAAARLWTEFLFSTKGQNLFLAGGARPVTMAAMQAAGTLDKRFASKLPKAPSSSVVLTVDQVDTAVDYLNTHWASAIG
jgi:putative spermidine/putrescine transport system substrate-binding protein